MSPELGTGEWIDSGRSVDADDVDAGTSSAAYQSSGAGARCSMKCRLMKWRWGLLVFLATGFGWLGSAPAFAQIDPRRVDEFLQAARERGFYDAAEYYLEKLAADANVSADLKAGLPFRRAQVLFEKTKTLNNIEELKKSWGEAVEIANQHVANSKDLDQKLQAIQLIAQVHAGLAEFQRRQAKLPWERLSESATHAEEARKELLKTVEAHTKGSDLLLEELREAKKSTDAARRATFDDNTNRFLNHLVSKMMYQDRLSMTYLKSSPEYQPLMEKLAKENAEYAAKYKIRAPFDSYFQMYRVKALLQLGKWQEAAPVIDDTLLLDASYYAPLKREMVLLGNDLWFREQPYKIELALAQLEKIAKDLTDEDMHTDIAQRIMLALAKAHHQRTIFTEALEVPTPEQRTAGNVSTRRRAEIARQLSRFSTPIADEARELLKEWGVRGSVENVKEVTTFGEAKQAALEVLMQGIKLQAELSKLSEADAQLPENQARQDEVIAQANAALSWLDRSFELVSPETRRVDMNMARLYQCQGYWLKGYYLEAALIGQFLLDRFPNELGTAEAAALGAQALHRIVMLRKAEGIEVEFEQRQMVQICEQVLKRWPERKESGDVAFMLITTELDRKNFLKAEEVLGQLSAENPKRPTAELRMGIAALQEADAINRIEGATAEQIQQRDELRKKAQEWLTAALGRANAEVSILHFVGAAALAQVLNDQQRFADTLQLLENPPLSAISLVEKNDPLVADANIQTNLIQSAVIAHMGRMSESGDSAAATDRVAALLSLLQQRLQANPRAAQILQSYYSLTLRKLREQVAADISDAARQNLTMATVKIFDPIIGPSEDWRLVSVLGETLLGMANSLPDAQKELKTQTFETAARCYEQALKLTAAQAQEPDIANFRTTFQVKSAAALRGQGKFDPASKQLATLLKANPKNPLIQMELAELYLQWGIASRDRAHIRTALMGQGKGTDGGEMWGWKKLAQATISDPKNKNAFYQALVGMVTCYYQSGKIDGDAKYIDAALDAVKKQYARDKTLGGPESFGKLDRLVKEIQKHAKRTVNGIQGL